MARAGGLLCDLLKRSRFAFGEKTVGTGQVGNLATLFEATGYPSRIRSTQIQPAADCSRCARCNIHDRSLAYSRKGDKRDLAKAMYQDQTPWWDIGPQERSSVVPDSWRKEFGKAGWVDNTFKPAWVEAELTSLDVQADHIAPCSLSSDYAHQLMIDSGAGMRFASDSVKELCQQGQVKGAVERLQVLVGMSSGIDKHLLYSVLKECVVKKDLILGGQVHALAVKMGLGSDRFLCSHFIRMYAGQGKLQEAMDVFGGVAQPDAFMCSSIISAHVKQGQARRAIEMYQHMRATRMQVDGYVLVAALQACAAAKDLEFGKQVRNDVLTSGMEHDKFICSCLVDMFAKCGSLKDARRVFDGLRQKDVVIWTAMIAGYAQQDGMGQEALSLYSAMQSEGLAAPNAVTYVCLLQACANVGVFALERGKQLHSQLKDRGLESDVGGSVVNMYVKCGSIKDAHIVFDRLGEKNVVTWTAMIAGYAQQEGMGQEALRLYSAMHDAGLATPDAVTFVCLLQACANVGVTALGEGKQLHSRLKERNLESDVVVGGSLVNMYVKCGRLEDARIVFDGLRQKSVVTWNAMISGYAQQESMAQEAFTLYSAMLNEGMAAPDAVTFVCLLQACASVGSSALEMGKQLHSQLNDRCLGSLVDVGGSLVNMYAKCGSLKDAKVVFESLDQKSMGAWNALISGYAQQEGMGQEALALYSAMFNEGNVDPDAVTFVCLLQACANVGVPALEKGKQLHSQLKERRLESEVVVSGSLVNMYVKCGSLRDARIVFDGLAQKSVVTWNAMMSGYAQQEGMGQEALNIYSDMHNAGMVASNAVTFVCLLQACANVGVSALEKGEQFHLQLKERGLESDIVVGGSLVNMYAKCGSLKDARIVFDRLSQKSVSTWNAMISGYAQQGMGQEALDLYSAMYDAGKVVPDAVTYVCLLQACANVGMPALERGKQLHLRLQGQRHDSDVVVGGSLVNMYAKCGSLKEARIVFDELGQRSLVTWNAMIGGYAQQEGMGQEALNMYSVMREEGMTIPNSVTYVCLLQACAAVGALQQGKQLHSEIREAGFEFDEFVATSLVKMYAKCGCLDASRELFDRLPVKSLVTWNALLKGYAEHGEGGMAIQCFEELLQQGIQPDEVTYVCLFTACSHAGLVDQGQKYFEGMMKRHGVEPNDRHCNCMVDLLGRSGYLDRAEKMLRASGLAGNTVSWTALLSACKSFGHEELGRRCFEHLVELEPTIATPYVLLGSIYANTGRWGEVDSVESLRKGAGARKKAAKACIEVKKEIHEFTVGEERSDVAATLRKMNIRVKEGGHVPQTQLVLRAVSEQEKEDALCGHAEKLALAYGLLNTPAGSPLVVTKNLRMCDDCHSSTKTMSRLEKREIVVRDGHKVHCFRNGVCSCQDRL